MKQDRRIGESAKTSPSTVTVHLPVIGAPPKGLSPKVEADIPNRPSSADAEFNLRGESNQNSLILDKIKLGEFVRNQKIKRTAFLREKLQLTEEQIQWFEEYLNYSSDRYGKAIQSNSVPVAASEREREMLEILGDEKYRAYLEFHRQGLEEFRSQFGLTKTGSK